MKASISRQSIYILLLSVTLLIFVLLFSFLVLIPNGKEYRKLRIEMKKEKFQLHEFQSWYDQTYSELKELQSHNKHTIIAFDNLFSLKRFIHQHKQSFEALHLSKITQSFVENGFDVYEVNATSKIDTPQTFYDFIDDVSKSDWIVGINFPIKFVREGSLIHSNFTMKVYRDSNSSHKEVKTSSSLKR